MHQTSFCSFREAQSHNLSICTAPCVASQEKAEDNGRDQSESAPVLEPSGGTRRIHSLCFIPGVSEEQPYNNAMCRDIREDIPKRGAQGSTQRWIRRTPPKAKESLCISSGPQNSSQKKHNTDLTRKESWTPHC